MRMGMLALVMAAAGAAAMGLRLPDPAPGPFAQDGEACSRFLFLAVFEGLWEDGADPAVIQAISSRREEHFVIKCPICMPVSHAFSVYTGSQDVDIFPSRGRTFPNDLREGLKSPVRQKRLEAIEQLVDRYVSRRFERGGLSESEKAQMRARLAAGKKLGMSFKGAGFGDFCPSCNGATRSTK